MLSNQEYVGDTDKFKTYSKSNKLKNDLGNILIFKDTHEGIVDRKTFDLVQKHYEGRSWPDKHGETDKYAGYLFCGDCGKRLYLHRAKENVFACAGHKKRTKELDNIIRCLYEDRVTGRITPERYDTMAIRYEQEQAELQQELTSITERISEMDMREKCIQEFMDRAKSYIEMPKLTP